MAIFNKDELNESINLFNECADYVLGCLNETYEIDVDLLRESAQYVLNEVSDKRLANLYVKGFKNLYKAELAETKKKEGKEAYKQAKSELPDKEEYKDWKKGMINDLKNQKLSAADKKQLKNTLKQGIKDIKHKRNTAAAGEIVTLS